MAVGRMTEQESGNHDLLARLSDAEETIRAIYSGEVDALVVNSPSGPGIYTLEGADHPYRLMVEQMHEGTITLNRDGLVLYSNPYFSAMMGDPSEPVTGSLFDRFLQPLEAHVFEGLVESAGVRGYSSGELNLLAVDGGLVPVRLSLTQLEIADVQTICVLASDLREQRRNEALVKEEQLSRLVLEQAGEGIVFISPLGTIVRCSVSARNLAARPALLNSFDDVFPLTAAQSPLTSDHILSTVSGGEHMRGIEARMRRPDGGISSLLVSASPLRGPTKELLGCVITLTDISDRKRLEEAQAFQARELARSNSDLRQFAYSASHDLREPLRQVAVFNELLQEKFRNNMDDEAGQLIQHTVDAAHRMEALLRDLLAYTQVDDTPQQVTRTDANEVCRNTVAIFEEQITQSHAHVDCGPLPVLDVHEVHLTQLFQNLIGNALKYKGEAAPYIRISAERAGELWKISVEDNGIGIHPDYQKQIFGLFKRLHGGGKYSGSGMGLAICQKIVRRYGGRIWVESEVGRGSRFMFTLPGETP